MQMRVFIVNSYWNNHGDEAANRALIEKLLENNVEVSIAFRVFEKFRNCTFDSQKVNIIEIRDSKYSNSLVHARGVLNHWLAFFSKGRILNDAFLESYYTELKKADLVVYAPGGALCSNMKRGYIFSVFLLLHAKKMKIPYMFYAPSMGPYKKSAVDLLVKKLINEAEIVCVREEISKKFIKKFGIKKNIHVTMDSAFQSELDIEKCKKILAFDQPLTDFLNKYSKIVGITITDLLWNDSFIQTETVVENITKTMQALLADYRDRGIGVLFLPQLFGEQNDVRLLKRFENDHTFTVNENYDCYVQQYLIKKLWYVIGMRYHSNIFSAKMGVPFISIAYDYKMRGFMRRLHIEKYCLEVNDLNISSLKERIVYLEAHYDEYKKHLQRASVKCKQLSLKTTEFLLELLNKKNM